MQLIKTHSLAKNAKEKPSSKGCHIVHVTTCWNIVITTVFWKDLSVRCWVARRITYEVRVCNWSLGQLTYEWNGVIESTPAYGRESSLFEVMAWRLCNNGTSLSVPMLAFCQCEPREEKARMKLIPRRRQLFRFILFASPKQETWYRRQWLEVSPNSKVLAGSTWGSPGSCRPQMGPILVPRTLLSGPFYQQLIAHIKVWVSK